MNLTKENYSKKLISYVMEHLGGEIGRERQRRRGGAEKLGETKTTAERERERG